MTKARVRKKRSPKTVGTVYKGRRIVVTRVGQELRLQVDGEPVKAEHMGRTYWTNLAPYATYSGSLIDLAKALIDMRALRAGKRK